MLALSGELDVASADVLSEQVRAVGADLALIIDLRGLEFIDSSGIGTLVRASQGAQERGQRFALVRGGGQVSHLLELTGLTQRLTVVGEPADLLGD